MSNYVNKNQLGISLYANTEQLIVKVVFVLASRHYLGPSRIFLIHFSSTGKYKKETFKNPLKTRSLHGSSGDFTEFPPFTLSSLFCAKRDDNDDDTSLLFICRFTGTT